jgi:hypothetical protein
VELSRVTSRTEESVIANPGNETFVLISQGFSVASVTQTGAGRSVGSSKRCALTDCDSLRRIE